MEVQIPHPGGKSIEGGKSIPLHFMERVSGKRVLPFASSRLCGYDNYASALPMAACFISVARSLPK